MITVQWNVIMFSFSFVYLCLSFLIKYVFCLYNVLFNSWSFKGTENFITLIMDVSNKLLVLLPRIIQWYNKISLKTRNLLQNIALILSDDHILPHTLIERPRVNFKYI